jgi:hypothetical protein
MNSFKTPKGTELPLLNLKGKNYLTVAYRVLWMREEHPEWSIETEYLRLDDKMAIAKATIRNGEGKLLAQGTKSETPQGFPDYIEKSESSAIGRALAFCGYGTQFAEELEEGERLADAPQAPHIPQHQPSAMSVSRTAQVQPLRTPGGLTQAQMARLRAIQRKVGISDLVLKQMSENFGILSSDSMDKRQYDMLCAALENYKGPA